MVVIKDAQKQSKESEAASGPTVWNLTRTLSYSGITNSEDLGQTHVGS